MNTLIIYGYEDESLVVLVDEDENILQADYANGMMRTIENSLATIFGEDMGETLYEVLATTNQTNLTDYNLSQYILYTLDRVSFNIMKEGLTECLKK